MRFKDTLRNLKKTESALFKENEQEIRLTNFAMVRQLTSITFFILVLSGVLSAVFYPPDIPFYLLLSLGAFVVFALCLIAEKRGQPFSLFTVYVYLTGLAGYGTYVGVSQNGQNQATSFIVLLVILPLLIIDHFRRITLFTILSGAIYCIFALKYKSPITAQADIINVSAFGSLSIFINYKISRIKLKEMHLRKQLLYERNMDSLTGLPNRRNLFSELIASEESGNAPISAMIMFDIDFFKQYNDAFGHQAGDDCLRRIGKCFSEAAEKYGVGIFRYGGEEFLAISRTLDYGQMGAIAKEIQQAVLELQIQHAPVTQQPFITLSAGYSAERTDGDGKYEATLSAADNALYEAKKRGRNRIVGSKEIETSQDFLPLTFR